MTVTVMALEVRVRGESGAWTLFRPNREGQKPTPLEARVASPLNCQTNERRSTKANTLGGESGDSPWIH